MTLSHSLIPLGSKTNIEVTVFWGLGGGGVALSIPTLISLLGVWKCTVSDNSAGGPGSPSTYFSSEIDLFVANKSEVNKCSGEHSELPVIRDSGMCKDGRTGKQSNL